MKVIYGSKSGSEFVYLQITPTAGIIVSGYGPQSDDEDDEDDEVEEYDFSNAKFLFMTGQSPFSGTSKEFIEITPNEFWSYVKDKSKLKKDLLRTIFK